MIHVDCITDPVLALALRIARRADELAREAGADDAGLGPWLRAEEEILGRRLPEPAVAAMGELQPCQAGS
jgi:hypothetical protein